MQVNLDPQLEAFVREQVESGHFATKAEVVGEALRPLDEHNRLWRLRAAAATGFAQLERGEGIPYSPELFEEIKRRAFDPSMDHKQPNPDVVP